MNRSFLYKADSKELWLIEPQPEATGHFDEDIQLMKKWEEYNSRLHYTCSPELAAILTEGQEVKENEFATKDTCHVCGDSDRCAAYCQENVCENVKPVAIPLPEQTKPKEDVRFKPINAAISFVDWISDERWARLSKSQGHKWFKNGVIETFTTTELFERFCDEMNEENIRNHIEDMAVQAKSFGGI